MAPGSRLDELTARYMQNPRRYFVPLANEYRQAQEFDRAIAMCREHLPSQPGHMSGHIVLARAYFERGDLLAARECFATSVELDDENLIALRHLGDIARARHEVAEARLWYARVLDVDPQNEEVEALLRAIDAAATDSTVDPAPPSVGTVAPDGAPTSGTEAHAARIGELVAVDPASLETFDLATLIGVDREMAAVDLPEPPLGALSADDVAQPVQAAATFAVSDPPAAVDAPEAGAGSGTIVGFGFSFDDLDALVEIPLPTAHAGEGEVTSVAGLELPDDAFASGPSVSTDQPTIVAPSAEASPSHPGFSALASFASWRTAQARDTPSSVPAHPTPANVAPIAEPAAARSFRTPIDDEPEPVDDERSLDAGVPAPEFMTETMAVLYAQQGYTQQALDIYLALQRQAPTDEAIAGTIVGLQQLLTTSESQASLQADADKALQYEDLREVTSLESDAEESLFASLPMVTDETLEAAFASAWSNAPGAADAGDDWFGDEADSGVSADVFTEPEGMFGVTLMAFAAPDPAGPADDAVIGAVSPVPVVALTAVFGGAVIGAADAASADLLTLLAVQMVGRLPKEAPTLPVPDVLELPASPAADAASGATPAPLLSFDRFFSGSGPAPRVRVDTPPAANRPSASPAYGQPSLSPTFGGLPVVAPPGSDRPAAWSPFDQFVPAAESGPVQVDAQAGRSGVASPASLRAEQSRADAPSPVGSDPVSPPPAHDQLAAGRRLDAPAAPAGEPASHDAELESARGPSSDFHRWLEGLS